MRPLTVEEAAGVLDVLGCGSDPIVVHSRDPDLAGCKTPDELGWGPPASHMLKAGQVQLTYTDRQGRRVRGTLLGMVKDRLEVKERNDRPQGVPGKVRQLGAAAV